MRYYIDIWGENGFLEIGRSSAGHDDTPVFWSSATDLDLLVILKFVLMIQLGTVVTNYETESWKLPVLSIVKSD